MNVLSQSFDVTGRFLLTFANFKNQLEIFPNSHQEFRKNVAFSFKESEKRILDKSTSSSSLEGTEFSWQKVRESINFLLDSNKPCGASALAFFGTTSQFFIFCSLNLLGVNDKFFCLLDSINLFNVEWKTAPGWRFNVWKLLSPVIEFIVGFVFRNRKKLR